MKKRSDGRYVSTVRVIDPLTGKKRRVFVYGYTEEEVIREITQIKQNNGSEVSSRNISFNSWVDEWMRIKKAELSENTFDSYTLLLNKHIKPYIGDISLKNITSAAIRGLLQHISGNRTKQAVYNMLHAILQQAYADELIRRNPCISVKAPRYTAKEKAIITADEFKSLFNAASEQYQRIFTVALYTGIRRGELCALRWGDIDFAGAVISVERSAKITNSGVIIGEPKTANSKRKILMPDVVIKALKKQRTAQIERYFKHSCKITDRDYVFTSEKFFNKIMPPNALSHAFIRAKKAAGITSDISFHSFRHTHTTMLVEAGASIKGIQMRLGHATPSFTLSRYAHGTTKMQQDIVNIINMNHGSK